jgi:hypothetical protein
MPKKRYNAEEIIHKLWEADILLSQGVAASLSGIGDGSRLYPAPDLGGWAHPPPPMGVGLLGWFSRKTKGRVVGALRQRTRRR